MATKNQNSDYYRDQVAEVKKKHRIWLDRIYESTKDKPAKLVFYKLIGKGDQGNSFRIFLIENNYLLGNRRVGFKWNLEKGCPSDKMAEVAYDYYRARKRRRRVVSDVELKLSCFSDKELAEELRRRGYKLSAKKCTKQSL